MAGKAILQRFCIPNETPLSEAEFHKICDGRPKQQELEKGPVSPDKSGYRTFDSKGAESAFGRRT